MTYLAFVRKERRLLSFALSFTFFSSFGQTFLISLFVPFFISAFSLSNASFGTLYSAATLTGAFALPWLGQMIDRVPLRIYSMYVAIGLMTASIIMAVSWHIATLFLGLILLRLAGQGLSSHTAHTAMARNYVGERGKALSISSLGFPLGEAILPSIIAFLLIYLHWQTTWALIAALIAFVFIPSLWFLIRGEKDTLQSVQQGGIFSLTKNYKKVFREPSTPFLIPAVLMPAFWVTGLFLYQVSEAGDLGWSTTLVASGFISFAVSRILFGLISGSLIDRFSARILFPFYLIPMITGFLIVVFIPKSWSLYAYMALTGATFGMGSPMKTALWAELFGTEMIGTVQSFFASLMVFSTALSPFLVGWMLDTGYNLHNIFVLALIVTLASALLSVRLFPRSQNT
jgi:MFS family permease